MAKITKVQAREILNSRAEPTVEAKIILDDGYYGAAAAPTGASISKFEAVEVRDGDVTRFAGLGVTKAIQTITSLISPKLTGLEVQDQAKIDQILTSLDGTENLAKLGVNAILPVSTATIVAAAASARMPLWKYISQNFFPNIKPKVPTPLFNIINGGKHGAANLDFQEFLVVPLTANSYDYNLQMGVEIYLALKKVLSQKREIYSVGDEGGFAPNLYTNAEAFEVLEEAASVTSFKPGRELFFGLDSAASHFQQDSLYVIKDRASPLNSQELIDFYKELINRFHLLILEDPLGEDDWDGWKSLTVQLGDRLIIVGDDLLATNPKRVDEAIQSQAANGILVKPNQIGTITSTFEIIKKGQEAGWKVVISHRSGETNDSFIADLSVATAADYVKFGAPARGERVAKYNRLSEIFLSLKQ